MDLFLPGKFAGERGIEPLHTVPETAVLPLDDSPIIPLTDWTQEAAKLLHSTRRNPTTLLEFGQFTQLVCYNNPIIEIGLSGAE